MAEELKDLDGPETTEAAAETPSITAGDLTTVINVIDAGSQRGAWKGEELAAIGALRNKFVAVLTVVAPDAVKTPEQVAEAETETETATDEAAA